MFLFPLHDNIFSLGWRNSAIEIHLRNFIKDLGIIQCGKDERGLGFEIKLGKRKVGMKEKNK